MNRATLFALAALYEPTIGKRLGEPALAPTTDAAAGSLQLSSDCTEACPGKTTLEGCFGVHTRKCQAELASKFELPNTNSADDNRQILLSFQASFANVSPEAEALAEATPAEAHVPSVTELLRSNSVSEVSSSSTSSTAEPSAPPAPPAVGDRNDDDDDGDPFSHSIEVGTVPNGMIGEESKLESTPDVISPKSMPKEADLSKTQKEPSQVEAEAASTSIKKLPRAISFKNDYSSGSGSAAGIKKGFDTSYGGYIRSVVRKAHEKVSHVKREIASINSAKFATATGPTGPLSGSGMSGGTTNKTHPMTTVTMARNSKSSRRGPARTVDKDAEDGTDKELKMLSAAYDSPARAPNPFAAPPPSNGDGKLAAQAQMFRFRKRTGRMADYPDRVIYPEHAFQPMLLNPRQQYVDYSNIGISPNTMPSEGLGYSRYRPTMPSASGVIGNQYGPGDIDAGNPYNSLYGYSNPPPTFGARPEGAYTERSDQASRFGGLFNPDALISGKPTPPPRTAKPKDMGQYPLTSSQGLPYSYMPPSGAFLMNNGYNGYNSGGMPGGEPMLATSSEDDAMPGTGAGKTASFLEKLSSSKRHQTAPALAPPRTWPIATYQSNQGHPNGVNQESVDNLTGKQFLETPSSLDTQEDAALPLPFPTMQVPQEMPSTMNPANPAYASR